LFESEKDNIDVDYLEEFMLNIMNDEFDVNIDDESGGEVAAKIIGLRKKTLEGDFRLVNEMLEKWQEKQRKGGDNIKAQFTQGQDNEDESDYDSDETDGDDDMDMDDAPSLPSAPKEKPLPEVDEDGFTKVVGKKKK
jgi:pre-rRNA-processing protein TSR2